MPLNATGAAGGVAGDPAWSSPETQTLAYACKQSWRATSWVFFTLVIKHDMYCLVENLDFERLLNA